MVTTELQDIKNNSPEQGRVKVVLRFPISVNLVLLRYETVLQKLLMVRYGSCLESVFNLRVKRVVRDATTAGLWHKFCAGN